MARPLKRGHRRQLRTRLWSRRRRTLRHRGFRFHFWRTSTSAGTCSWCRTPGAKTPRRAHPQVGFNGTSPLHSPSRLGRALTGSAHLARPQEPQIGTSSSRSTFGAAATCEQLPVAPASQADDPSVQTSYDSSSLSLSVAPSHPLSHASHRPDFSGASRPSATRPASPTSSRAGQWLPPSTSTPAGLPSAAAAARRAHRSMTSSTASAAVQGAASANGCGGCGAPGAVGDGAELGPAPALASLAAEGRLGGAWPRI